MIAGINSKTKKILLTGIILNLLAIIAYVGLFFVIKSKNAQTSLLLTEVELQKKKADRLATARGVVEAAKADAEKLASYGVGDESEQVSFVTFIENVGRGAHVSVNIQNLAVENQSSPKAKDYFTMKVTATGSWENVMNFFMQLESVPMDLIFEGIELVQKNISEQDGKNSSKQRSSWSGDINVRVLKFKN